MTPTTNTCSLSQYSSWRENIYYNSHPEVSFSTVFILLIIKLWLLRPFSCKIKQAFDWLVQNAASTVYARFLTLIAIGYLPLKAEEDVQNYVDRRVVININILQDLHNSSHHTNAEFNNCFIQ